MQIQCECGKFRAELKAFPKNTPGRVVCYCDDCQIYLHHIGRADLLDKNGGTEIIPAYPVDVKILSGKEELKCLRVTDKGGYRFYTACCNTPIANASPGRPWLGILRRAYTVKNPNQLDATLGEVRGRIMGKYAKGTPPPGTPKKFDLKGAMVVMPFMLKGRLLKKYEPSPFFTGDGTSPVAPAQMISKEKRESVRTAAGIPS